MLWVRVRLHVDVCMYLCLHVCTRYLISVSEGSITYIYTYIHVNMHGMSLHTCMYVCMYVCMWYLISVSEGNITYIYTYIHVNTSWYVYPHMYVCIYVCMYVCMYVCVYVIIWHPIPVLEENPSSVIIDMYAYIDIIHTWYVSPHMYVCMYVYDTLFLSREEALRPP
jgi:hypothetical protein